MQPSPSNRFLEHLDTEALIGFVQHLVQIRSVNDPLVGATEDAAAQAVVEIAKSFGWEPIVEYVQPGRPNVIVQLKGEQPGPHLIFEGHTDVVSEGDRNLWSFDPYGGDIVDGQLRGRGAADMKSGLGAMLYAARALEQSGELAGSLTLAALVDEEGLMLGVKDFVAKGYADGAIGAIVCEPEAGEVCTTQKGAIRLEVRFRGRIAHGAMPDQGANPIPAVADILAFAKHTERRLRREYGADPLLGTISITPTALTAGSRIQMNLTPPIATADFDIRTTPPIDHATLIAAFRHEVRAIANASGTSGEIEVIDDRPPTSVTKEGPLVQAMVEAHRQVYGEAPAYGGVPGTTDGTILFRDAKLPVVVYGPGGKWIAHQADEYVNVSEIIGAAKVYLLAARALLRPTQ
ncbi:MAG: M20 family metallopeptidase [Ferrimicrobium sp.]|jgi:succinyl-diaminopimelate desuccinylase|uniref:M20 family metallopeptidase n=1 Tax=Ferrimicrobium sp. TaxID=2926050 RepID=UPI002613BA2C|nr:M20 family metallopeptidase [Ferrimicrobium sp.]MCL5973303.1 M20 family metallopeptidase [Actinomycetota bacterium]